jgi:aryl-alcohol dehydrogenase-like predicted oxidoreductase
VVGARKPQQIGDAIRVLHLDLGPEDLAELEALTTSFPVAGTRFDEHQMKALDSERSSV